MASAILIIISTYVLMEVISWLIHKYIMHGILWSVHKTHHEPSNSFWEKNDIFSLFFGSIAIILIIAGSEFKDYRFWMGIGISLYGFSYFILHDIIIHKRVKLFNAPKIKYIEAISKAHRDHHKGQKRKCEGSYGLLIVPKKYFSKKIEGGNL